MPTDPPTAELPRSGARDSGHVAGRIRGAQPDDDSAHDLRAEPPTYELPTAGSTGTRSGGGPIAALSGVVMLVLLIMGGGMVIAQLTSAQHHQPGPGALAVGAHVAGAVVGVVCYGYSRRKGSGRLIALLATLLTALLLLWFFWWSPSPT